MGVAGNATRVDRREEDCHAFRLSNSGHARTAGSAGPVRSAQKKLEQLDRAEKLVAEIDPARTYPYSYLCFRITSFRPEATPEVAVPGDEARNDLLLFVEDVSDAANVPVEEVREPVYTVEQLSKNFNVSTKTISRWRRQGLVSRKFMFQGRKRVGFLSSSVQRFVSRNSERIERGGRFSQLTESERMAIIDRARRLAQAVAVRRK